MSGPSTPESNPSRPPGRRHRPLPPWAGPGTWLVHGGSRADLNAGAVVYPIYQTSTFRYPSAYSEASTAGEVFLYTRNRNPTVEGPAEVLRGLEGGEAARLFASGMAAVTSTVLSFVRSGDEVVALTDLYGGTSELLQDLLPRFGVRLREVTDAEARSPEGLFSPATRLALIESPTNPLLRVHDISRWSAAADRVGAVLVVDGTFATPINQRPLVLGADLVLHSATKYLGGHSDLIAGGVVGPRSLVERIDPGQRFGASLDPFAAFLLHRSLRTLGLRVARQNENARAVVTAIEHHPAVAQVHYPGRGSPEEEQIAARQMQGRGGVLSVSLRGGADAAERFLARLEIIEVAASLGGVESLASRPAATSHRHFAPEELARRGIDPGLVRLALGIEEPADLVRDVTQALDAASAYRPS